MKLELEPNMYVRTKYGISQYKQHKVIGSEDIKGILCKDGSRVIFVNIEDIIGEPSFEIIDLIQVGDYVNGKLVAKNEEVITTDNIYIGRYLYEEDNSLIGGEEDIKTIVTREQFEAMQYKVVEE